MTFKPYCDVCQTWHWEGQHVRRPEPRLSTGAPVALGEDVEITLRVLAIDYATELVLVTDADGQVLEVDFGRFV